MSLFDGKAEENVLQSIEQKSFEEAKKLLVDFFVDSAYMVKLYKKDNSQQSEIGAIVFWDYDSVHKYFKIVPTTDKFKYWWDFKTGCSDKSTGHPMIPLRYWGLELREHAGSLDPVFDFWGELDWIETGTTYKDCTYELHFKYNPEVPIYINGDRLHIKSVGSDGLFTSYMYNDFHIWRMDNYSQKIESEND